MKLLVIGAGSMGAALTFPLAANGHSPVLYGSEFDADTLKRLRDREAHPKLERRLPASVELKGPENLKEALSGAKVVLLAINTKGILPVMKVLLPHLDQSVPLISVAKGLVDLDGNAFPVVTAIRAYMKRQGLPHPPSVACLAGPSIAAEVARGVPTIVHLACEDEASGRKLAYAFSGPRFQCRYSPDLTGIETCAAYKNIYTIALSWPTGLSEQDDSGSQTNLKALLFLQSLKEIQRLIVAADGDPETALGIAGLGDLVTTDDAGRNGAFGRLLGSGKSSEEALRELAGEGIRTIEGYETTKPGLSYARSLSDTLEKQLPLLHEIHEVLHSGKSVRQAIDSLPLAEMACED